MIPYGVHASARKLRTARPTIARCLVRRVTPVRAAIDVRFTFMANVGIYNHGNPQSFAADQTRFLGAA